MSSTARHRLASLSRLTPRLTPATAESMATALTAAMIAHCRAKLVWPSRPMCTSPALSCTTPKPIDVAMPKKVLTRANVSATLPTTPFMRSPSRG